MKIEEYFEEFDQGVGYVDRMTAALLANGLKKPHNDRELAMIEYMKRHKSMPIPPNDVVAIARTWKDTVEDIRTEMKKLPIITKEENIKDLVEPTKLVPNFTLFLLEDIKLACQLIDKTLERAGKSKLSDYWKLRYQVSNIISVMLPEYENWLQFLFEKGYSSPVSMYPEFNSGCYVIIIEFGSVSGSSVIEFTDVIVLADRRGMYHNYSLQFVQ